MNAASLVLPPSGHADVSPSTSASQTSNAANAPADGSTFAGAMQAASPKPVRKSTPARTPHDTRAGGNLPAAGNQSPPAATAGAQTAAQAAAAQQAAAANSVTGADGASSKGTNANDAAAGAGRADGLLRGGEDGVVQGVVLAGDGLELAGGAVRG